MKETIATDGTRLKEALKKAGLTQADLMRATGYDSSVISRLCSGRWNASASEKMKISSALGRKVEEIFP